ncbi:MAG: hypothetical protein IPG84_14975 [Betaproteobacteria bacterium]|nr:hypothetical protein [Betaproteobacteria bacterium]
MHGLGIRALVGALACLLAFEAAAQDYPTRTITLINPAAPAAATRR